MSKPAMERNSPWGPLVVADAHVHFFSHRFFTSLVSQKPGLTLETAAAKLGWRMPGANPEQLAAEWVAELDGQHVAAACMIASAPGDESSVAAAAAAYPARLYPFAMVDPHNWNAEALAPVRAICLFPAMHRYSVHDDAAQKLVQWAAGNHKAVFVHCGVLRVGVRVKLELPSLFDLRYSNPVDLAAVASRFPNVPFIVPHFGAGYFREALMLADTCPNVYLDTSSSNHWMRYEEVSHPESRGGLRQVFRRAIDVIGPRRLLFGTDSSYFPRGWNQAIFEEQALALYEIGLSSADARSIFAENLLRILAA